MPHPSELMKAISSPSNSTSLSDGKRESAPLAPGVGFDLIAGLEDLIHSLGPRAHAIRLELNSRIAPNVPARVASEPAGLFQALTLLVDNAVRVTEKGEILVSVTSVEGVTPQTANVGGSQSLLFEVRASSTASAQLAEPDANESVAHCFETLGVKLTDRREPGLGCIWAFELGLEPVSGINQEGRELPSGVNGSSVLVADDNASTRSVLEELLSSWGIRVRMVDSGEAALEEIREYHARDLRFDALLLDARMPHMSGFEVAGKLVNNPCLCGPVLLLMPAPFRKGDESYSRRLGVAGIVFKPVRRAELLQALGAVLAGREENAATARIARSPSSLL